MALLIVSFVAGLLTVLAPCILPLLPIIIGGSLKGEEHDRLKPVIITGSLAASVVVFTLVLKFSTAFVDIPPKTWTYISGGIITIFGIISIFPNLWEKLSLKFNLLGKSNQLLGKSAQKKSLWGDVLIGASLGPVFSSCSPTYFIILATVLPQSFALGLVYLIAYAAGLSLVLLLISILGKKFVSKLNWASDPHGWFKRGLGILFLIVGLAIFTGVDKKVESYLLDNGLFDVTKIEQRLIEATDGNNMDDVKDKSGAEVLGMIDGINKDKKAMNYPTYKEITNPSGYVNSEEFKLEDIIGEKVVLLDFMTYSCINCIRTFPYLNDWYDKYQDDGLEIIGIHTPEFAFEKNIDNVREAMKKYGIKFPIVLDNDYGTWRAYGNQYWPRKYLIDIDGYVVYDHIGEGAYDETEMKIQELLAGRMKKLGMEGELDKKISELDVEKPNFTRPQSPETYFGTLRNRDLASQFSAKNTVETLSVPETIAPNKIYLQGDWLVTDEYVEARSAGAKIIYGYQAEKVFIVGSSEVGNSLTVYQDGKLAGSAAGSDAVNSMVSVQEEDLYRVIEDDKGYGQHVLELEVGEPGFRAFAFTFG